MHKEVNYLGYIIIDDGVNQIRLKYDTVKIHKRRKINEEKQQIIKEYHRHSLRDTKVSTENLRDYL